MPIHTPRKILRHPLQSDICFAASSLVRLKPDLLDIGKSCGEYALHRAPRPNAHEQAIQCRELAFRDEARAFLRDQLAGDIGHKVRDDPHLEREDYVRWQKILHARGWACVNWPVGYGGTGWTPVQKYIFASECAFAHAPRIVPFGLAMVGPVIYTFGNAQQKARFLPDILASNVWWCQGYSEPNAGSDLASLRTSALREGEHYVVNGTRTWNTVGQWAEWIFCPARTGAPKLKPQARISFLLIDMKTPGITVSPIRLLDGAPEVNEVHFDNVRVPVANLVGEELTRPVSAVKSRIGRAMRRVGQEAIQLHGGLGVTDELDVGHYFERLTAIEALFGNTDFHLHCFGEAHDR